MLFSSGSRKVVASSTKLLKAPTARRSLVSTPIRTERSKGAAVIPKTSIRIFRDIESLRQWRHRQALDHRSVGLVPTMGALHAGHISLIRLAAQANSRVVVSIYVNPSQFGAHEDLASYPKTWEGDTRLLARLDRELADDNGGGLGSIAAVFSPTDAVMYPSGFPGQDVESKGSFVTITPVGEVLEGRVRPTFFRGVATVCMKLFNIVRPDRVYFGQKDVQQTVLIKKMVQDFCVGAEVVVGETTRETDGLAMSSRNVYLGERRRRVGTVLINALRVVKKAYEAGARTRGELLAPAHELLRLLTEVQMAKKPAERVRFEIEYISLADPETMMDVEEKVDETKGAIVSGAVRMLPVEEPGPDEDLGSASGPAVRLIDNIILKPVKKKSSE